MPTPEVKVEIAFGDGFSTLIVDRTYTDVSAYVEAQNAVTITHGRNDELTAPSPGSCTLTLDNRDGRFTPEKASGAYYPNIKKGKPIKVSVRYTSIWYTRFTGYIDEWALSWPDGSDAASHMAITCSTRRARLGQGVPLPSAIRAAYLETEPNAYWPMDEDTDVTDPSGTQVFRDITNDAGIRLGNQLLGAYAYGGAAAPVVRDGTAGPTDEQSLVKIPAFSDAGLVGTYPHFVGSGGAFSLTTPDDVTLEVVARCAPGSLDAGTTATFATVMTGDRLVQMYFLMGTNGAGAPETAQVAATLAFYNPDGTVLGARTTFTSTGYNNATYQAVSDGGLHHFAMTLSPNGSDTDMKAYIDGVQLGSTETFSTALTVPFTQIAMGDITWNTNLWVGHAAVHDRALTVAEILAHANAATAATETVEERVERVAGRLGVPASEVVVEATIASDLGPQPEAGRSGAEVLDEVAFSTGGIFYDARDGTLAMQARNHRYNAAVAFTLNATTQEIGGDLLGVLDDRYLVNTVDATRAASSELAFTAIDQDSIDEYGVYAQQHQIVASHDLDVEAAAQNLITKYAEPRVRVSTVGVDVTNLSAAQIALLMAADIGTLFQIEDLPAQAPTDPLPLFLEGYTETITATSHSLSMNTTPGPTSTVWILEDATYGVLDTTTILAY